MINSTRTVRPIKISMWFSPTICFNILNIHILFSITVLIILIAHRAGHKPCSIFICGAVPLKVFELHLRLKLSIFSCIKELRQKSLVSIFISIQTFIHNSNVHFSCKKITLICFKNILENNYHKKYNIIFLTSLLKNTK